MGTVTLKQPKELTVPALGDPIERERVWQEAERAARADQRRRLARKKAALKRSA